MTLLQRWSGWTASQHTIFWFGVAALLLGGFGILRPEQQSAMFGPQVGQDGLGFVVASSMAAFNVGAYYILAALGNVQPFFRWTVPFRTLTFLVFTGGTLLGHLPAPFLGVALWELLGALATGATLWRERTQQEGHV